MSPNQSLLVCESVLARLDTALEIASAEAKKAKAAEERLETLLSEVRRLAIVPVSEIRIARPKGHFNCRSQTGCTANDNPVAPGCFSPLALLEGRMSDRTQATT